MNMVVRGQTFGCCSSGASLSFTDLKLTMQDRLAGQQDLGSTWTTPIEIRDYKYMPPVLFCFRFFKQTNHHESGYWT